MKKTLILLAKILGILLLILLLSVAVFMIFGIYRPGATELVEVHKITPSGDIPATMVDDKQSTISVLS